MIAERVNNHCSNPMCRVGTTGPQTDPNKALMLGVAAHITAAAPRGPRYDSNMADDARAAAANGIWLCQNCAKLVDNDEIRFSVALLLRWKETAEALALDNIGKSPLFARQSAPAIDVIDNQQQAGVQYAIADLQQIEPRRLFAVQPAAEAKVEVLARGRNALDVPFAVIGVSDRYGWKWDVTYFMASEEGWHAQAHIRLEGQKGHTPQVQYISGAPGALLVQHMAGTGTGVSRRLASLYRIGAGIAEPILHFPIHLHVVGWGMPFDRYLDLVSMDIPAALKGDEAINLKYRLHYAIAATDSGLLDYEHKFSLVWDEAASQFVPAESSDDFSILDDIWNEDMAGFVKRCRADLLRLSTIGNDEQMRFVQAHVV